MSEQVHRVRRKKRRSWWSKTRESLAFTWQRRKSVIFAVVFLLIASLAVGVLVTR